MPGAVRRRKGGGGSFPHSPSSASDAKKQLFPPSTGRTNRRQPAALGKRRSSSEPSFATAHRKHPHIAFSSTYFVQIYKQNSVNFCKFLSILCVIFFNFALIYGTEWGICKAKYLIGAKWGYI